jgi:hypothetical protein
VREADDVAEPTVAHGSGGGPTEVGTTGTGIDGIVAGAALVLTLYGLVAIVADLLFHQSLIPDSAVIVGLIIAACLVVGAVLGAIGSARSDR